MVYCTKCGTKNEDGAEYCVKCGAPLHGPEHIERRWEEECFGLPYGGTIVGLAIGIIIVFAGLVWILQQAGLIPEAVSVWPLAVVILGILIIVGAVHTLSRRR